MYLPVSPSCQSTPDKASGHAATPCDEPRNTNSTLCPHISAAPVLRRALTSGEEQMITTTNPMTRPPRKRTGGRRATTRARGRTFALAVLFVASITLLGALALAGGFLPIRNAFAAPATITGKAISSSPTSSRPITRARWPSARRPSIFPMEQPKSPMDTAYQESPTPSRSTAPTIMWAPCRRMAHTTSSSIRRSVRAPQ